MFFIMIDDLGYNDIGYQSTDLGKVTPNLDKLAAGGVKVIHPFGCLPKQSQLCHVSASGGARLASSVRNRTNTYFRHDFSKYRNQNVDIDSFSVSRKSAGGAPLASAHQTRATNAGRILRGCFLVLLSPCTSVLYQERGDLVSVARAPAYTSFAFII